MFGIVSKYESCLLVRRGLESTFWLSASVEFQNFKEGQLLFKKNKHVKKFVLMDLEMLASRDWEEAKRVNFTL